MDNSQVNKLSIVAASDGTLLAVAGGTYRIVISGKETGNEYAVIEMIVPPGGGPGPHSHAGFQESFYVLEGEVELKTQSGKFTAVKGSFINIPLGGMVHCFKNNSDKVARLWCTVVPAGLEQFFLEVGQPVQEGKNTVPPPIMTPERMEQINAIAEKYGQKLFPPDYLD